MAIKKPSNKKTQPKKKQKQKTVVIHKPLSDSARKRLKKLPGSSRQYYDPKTKKTYSRRQFEKGRIKSPRKNAPEISRKYHKYLTIRDIYISSQAGKGKHLTKRQAMDSKKFQKLVKDLHHKDTKDDGNRGKKIRSHAWEQLTGGRKSEWTPYINRWVKGEL